MTHRPGLLPQRWVALVAFSIAVAHASASGTAGVRDTYATDAIVFERHGDLYAVSLAGHVRRLTYTPAWYESEPAVSPDGRTIVYSRASQNGSGGFGLWTLNTADAHRRLLTNGPYTEPAWTPDGDSVYFVHSFTNRQGDNCGSISRVTAESRAIVRVTRGPLQFDPAVSPFDGRVVFVDADHCSGGAATQLKVRDAAGRETNDLGRLRRYPSFWQPSWSPDGSRVTFSSIDGNGGVFVANRDGSGLRRVVAKGMKSQEPSWSPSGRLITFVGGPSEDIYVVRPDGTGLRRLARTTAAERSPSWFPTGG